MTRTLQRVVVGAVADFPPGRGHSVEALGKSVAVFNVDGTFYALRNVCPHQGAPLAKGAIVGTLTATEPGCFQYDAGHKHVRCPWHGWEYDLASGRSSFDPKRNRVKPFPVTVEEGASLVAGAAPGASERVEGPYVAETFSISVESDYVVIEL